MDSKQAIAILGALGQNTRLCVFQTLVRHEPVGLPAGELAASLGVPQNTLSAHLSILSRTTLVNAERHGRSMIYRADLSCLRNLMLFLAKDCCGGSIELCAPLIAELTTL